ncbi:hypothetical protein SS50377_21407 [Spironucleus salmonicida]|uniref:Uncharacterized protein n=1 Tax=Spironucleus salmonicida TaxID=348837 RepID=V6LW65_9EUKA|nr:hypothetical protein SS50377_21407 [Spironucleus salmonicida]|eukprot:EST47951.1 Hypothetical protein SS50377_11935 [Spironucleus salmonicida]
MLQFQRNVKISRQHLQLWIAQRGGLPNSEVFVPKHKARVYSIFSRAEAIEQVPSSQVLAWQMKVWFDFPNHVQNRILRLLSFPTNTKQISFQKIFSSISVQQYPMENCIVGNQHCSLYIEQGILGMV